MDGPLRLRPMGLFAIISDAAFSDGKIEPFEQKILNRIAVALKLDKKVAKSIARRSRERYSDGKLGEEKPLSPKIVYRHSLEVACADKTIDTTERVLLDTLRELFKISTEYHNAALGRIQDALRRKLRESSPVASESSTSESKTSESVTSESEALLPEDTNADLARKASSILAALDKRCEPEPEVDLSSKRSAVRAAEKIFQLKPSGLPVPLAVDMVFSAIGAIVFMGAFIALNPILQGLNSGSFLINLIYLLFVFGSCGFYWVERKRYRRKLLLDYDQIKIGLRYVTIPGFALGEYKKIKLSRDDIDVFATVEGSSEQYSSLNFVLGDSSKVLRLDALAIEDISLLCKTIEDFMDKPIVTTNESYLKANYQHFLSIGIILLSATLVWFFLS